MRSHGLADRMSLIRLQADRFWSKVEKNGPILRPDLGPCWLWTDVPDEQGYGDIIYRVTDESGERRQFQTRAHRAALIISGVDLPDDLQACHRCDNPPCVNPAHLFAGTNQDNVDDMIAKGRHVPPTPRYPTHCKNGHAFDEVNTHHRKRGKWNVRECRACNRAAQLRSRLAKAGAAAP